MFLTLFLSVFFFWSELIQVVRGCCVARAVWSERDPESAEGLWRCIRAGRASWWCRIQDPAETQRLPQLELLPGCRSLADVSARLVHQAFIFHLIHVCVYIKSDLFFFSSSSHRTRLTYNQRTQRLTRSTPNNFNWWPCVFLWDFRETGAVSVQVWVKNKHSPF